MDFEMNYVLVRESTHTIQVAMKNDLFLYYYAVKWNSKITLSSMCCIPQLLWMLVCQETGGYFIWQLVPPSTLPILYL